MFNYVKKWKISIKLQKNIIINIKKVSIVLLLLIFLEFSLDLNKYSRDPLKHIDIFYYKSKNVYSYLSVVEHWG